MKHNLKLGSKLSLVIALSASLLLGAPLTQPVYAEANANVLEVIETASLSQVEVTGASEGRMLFYDDSGKYGFMDYEGNIVIPAKYEYATMFSSGIAEVETENGVAYIDLDGNIAFYAQDILDQFDLDSVYPEIQSFSDGVAVVSTYDSVGYINTKGEFIIPMDTYYNGYKFTDGVAEVYDSNYKTTYIDKDGNTLFEPNPDLSYYGFVNGMSIIYNYDNSQYGYVDKSGEIVIKTTLDDATDFVGDIAVYSELGKKGIINKDGEFLIHPLFEELVITEDGYVLGYDGVFTTILDKNLKPMRRIIGEQTYNVDGNVYINPTMEGYMFEDLAGNELGMYDDYYYLGDHLFELTDGKILSTKGVESKADENSPIELSVEYEYIFLNNEGEVAIDLSEYDKANAFSDGLAVVEKNGKFGYINTDGEIVIPIKYIYASDFADGEASVETASDYLVINKSGETLLTGYYYDSDESEDESDYYVISTGYYGDSGIADRKTNKIILEPTYYDVSDAGGGLFELADENYNYGFYNANTGKLVEPMYEYLEINAEEGRVIVQNSEYLYGLYDIDGNQILEPAFDSIYSNGTGMYEVTKDYLSGIVTSAGKMIIKPDFSYIYSEKVSDDIIVFTTQKTNDDYSYEEHILVYDAKNDKVISDDLEGSVVGAGSNYIVIDTGDGKKTISTFEGKKIFTSEDYFVDSDEKYLHFEDSEGVDYLVDLKGNKYLENNGFDDVFLPSEDDHLIFYMDNGFGIVSVDGEIKTKKLYENVNYISSGIMATYDDDMFGYVNVNGKSIVEEGYYDMLYGFTDGRGLVIKAK